ncbi:MAG: hypothetical protein ABW006_08790 [Hyphomicrobium sp.]
MSSDRPHVHHLDLTIRLERIHPFGLPLSPGNVVAVAHMVVHNMAEVYRADDGLLWVRLRS